MQNSILSVQDGKTRYPFNQLPWHLKQGHGTKAYLIRHKKERRKNKHRNFESGISGEIPKVGRVKNSNTLYDEK